MKKDKGLNSASSGLANDSIGHVIKPQQTLGAFPYDLSSNAGMYRQDITEGHTGVPLSITLTFVNINDSCIPLSNTRVDLWHCDKEGRYSDVSEEGKAETFLRGIQMTDKNGQVSFKTIYPGWYAGRATHVHFQLMVNSILKAESQLAFPDMLNEHVYTSAEAYKAHGVNTSVTANAADNVFTGGTEEGAMLVISGDIENGYTASLTIGVDVPATGIAKLAPETGGQFVLEQNYPNPIIDKTMMGFSLLQDSNVWLDVYDAMGQKLMEIANEQMKPGVHKMEWERNNLPAGNYMYQLNVQNKDGIYRQTKVMTVC